MLNIPRTDYCHRSYCRGLLSSSPDASISCHQQGSIFLHHDSSVTRNEQLCLGAPYQQVWSTSHLRYQLCHILHLLYLAHLRDQLCRLPRRTYTHWYWSWCCRDHCSCLYCRRVLLARAWICHVVSVLMLSFLIAAILIKYLACTLAFCRLVWRSVSSSMGKFKSGSPT